MNSKLNAEKSQPEDYDNEYDEFEEDDQEENKRRKFTASPIFLLSVLIHAFIIGILVLTVMHNPKPAVDVIITTTPILPEEEIEEEKELDIVKEKIEVEVEIETPPIVTDEVVEDQNETENEMDAETAEGVSEAISDMPLIGTGVMGNIGGGSGGGGAFGSRSGGGKKRAVMKGGGSKKTESAVNSGLRWLATHQEAQGHWDCGKYEGNGSHENNAGTTGAALLAFLGAGHTDRVGKYKDNVKKAIKWIMDHQKEDGSFAEKNYANAICTMALAEAFGMGCGDIRIKQATVKAVDYILKEQNPSGGFNYTGPSGRDDMSVIGWCVMALKSAMVSGIRVDEVKKVFEDVGKLLNKTEHTKDNASSSKGEAWYGVYTKTNKMSNKGGQAGGSMQAIAMLIRQYLGWHRSENWLAAAANGQVTKMPKGYQYMHVYRVYYSYLTLFQQGGDKWKTWNSHVTPILVKAQRTDGDFKGSWDPRGGMMRVGGRPLNTAFLCLSLEIYYRYKSVME